MALRFRVLASARTRLATTDGKETLWRTAVPRLMGLEYSPPGLSVHGEGAVLTGIALLPGYPHFGQAHGHPRGTRRLAFADVATCVRLFGRLPTLGLLRASRTLLRATEARLRNAWLTEAAFGNAAETSGSRTTTFELALKRS